MKQVKSLNTKAKFSIKEPDSSSTIILTLQDIQKQVLLGAEAEQRRM